MTAIQRANGSKLDLERFVSMLRDWAAGTGPVYRQLADRVGHLVATGELRDGELLPPERQLAVALSASRSTVVAAYDLLRERGVVQRRQGSGTRVVGPQLATSVGQDFKTAPLFAPGAEIATLLKAIPDPLPGLVTTLPTDAHVLDVVDPDGLPELRRAIADRMTSEGLPTASDGVIVTNGAQQAISLVIGALCGPGDVVLTEEYTWPGLTDVVARQGGRCFGIRMDEHGIDTAELRAAVERLRPVAIALNPHHQNPTATRLLPHRRREVADIAADYGVTVVEDRVAAPLAFDGVVPPPLAVHRPDAPMATVESLSKTIWPGLRIGWLRAGPDLLRQVRLGKAIVDQFTSIPSQYLAIGILEHADGLIAERTTQLAARAEVAYDAVRTLLPDWEVELPAGGLVLWPRLPIPAATALIHHAARSGLLIAGAEAFSVSQPVNDRIRVPFTAPEGELVEAIERLAQAWRTLDPAASVPPPPAGALIV